MLFRQICAFVCLVFLFPILLLGIVSCRNSEGTIDALWTQRAEKTAGIIQAGTPGAPEMGKQKPAIIPIRPSPRPPGERPSPTPDPPLALPTLRMQPAQVIVEEGDTLKKIARRYRVSLADLIAANSLTNPDLLQIGQNILVPPQRSQGVAPSFKVIPDGELVYGPYAAGFDVHAWMQERGGSLANYEEEVDGVPLQAPEIVARVAREVSVNPRLLLALLEYQGGWLTKPTLAEAYLEYPLGFINPERRGLYRQLSWAAGELSLGYYLWPIQGIGLWVLKDGSAFLPFPQINPGTAGVQELLSELYGQGEWERALSPEGFYKTYTSLFGDAFDYSFDPLLPDGLEQPHMQLPFERGVVWTYTGGPHGGWTSETGWAALDFAPPADEIGCQPSNDWVTAIADGLIVFSQDGAVIQDLDLDGYWQTGWSILYMHVEGRERVRAGTLLGAGERIGHPSCEGGVSTGTHVHVARRYNGVWISADGSLPFVMDGWVSAGTGTEYNGTLNNGSKTLTADSGRSPANEITR